MATKAELQAELTELRRQLRDRPEAAPETAAPDTAESSPEPEAPHRSMQTAFEQLLKDHGLSSDDMRGLMDQLNEELGHLPQDKPLLTALGAFGLGFVLGRLSK